jgi:hypothetical protein
MIRFLNDETVDGHRYGKGVLARFDRETEAELLAVADAENYPLPILISQSYSPVTRSSNNSTDTTYVTLATVTVPGGTMNYNGKIVIEHDWKYTNSASTKGLRIDWGGVWIAGPSVSASVNACFMLTIKNANSPNSQLLLDSTTYSTSARDATASADTTQDVAIDIKCNWGANVASEQIILRGYSIWYYPGND